MLLQTGQPQQSREVTAELGCVTPYIVCPGQWSQADLNYHAGTVVAGMTHNAGHNCLKAEVLLLDKDWPQREAFLTALRYSQISVMVLFFFVPQESPTHPVLGLFCNQCRKASLFELLLSSLCGCWHESQCQAQLLEGCTCMGTLQIKTSSMWPAITMDISNQPYFSLCFFSTFRMSCVMCASYQYRYCNTHKWFHRSVQHHSLIAVQESAG